jgi:hypothetical protein
MSMALETLQPRYVSHRYPGWTIADATYLYTLQAAGVMLLLLLVLPRVSDRLFQKQWRLTPIQSAAVLCQVSLMFSVLGTTIEGFAPTAHVVIVGAMVQTLASGAPAAFRALAGSLVQRPHDTAKVFTGLAIVDTLSGMAAGPVVAGLYNLGIQRAGVGTGGGGGEAWLGLPFVVTAVLKGVLTMIMCTIRFGG